MTKFENQGRRSLSKAVFAFVWVLFVCALFAGWYSLFRTISVADSQGQMIDISRHWGRPSMVRIDRNQDSKVDYRAIPDPEARMDSVLAVSPREFWSDDDFDGMFETHVILGLESERPVQVYEYDRNGDGSFDVHLNGEEADEAYGDWLLSHASDPARGPEVPIASTARAENEQN